MYLAIKEKVKEHIEEVFKSEKFKTYSYHSLDHTKQVVNYSLEIGKGEGLSEKDLTILEIAAWFHDIGYEFGFMNHEERGVGKAVEFLENLLPAKDLHQISELIMATRLNYPASNLMERIIQDADICHMGSSNYIIALNNLREEWLITQNRNYSNKEWLKLNISFFETRNYLTKTGSRLFDNIKVKNLENMKKELDDLNVEGVNQNTLKLNEKKVKKKKDKKKKKKKSSTARGRETAYRVALRNHVNLSKIADNKANIMLSVNALILSYVLSANIGETIGQAQNIIPALCIIATSLFSILTATLATKPKVTHGHLSADDIKNKKGNPLFFGNFHSMDVVEFENVMNDLMEDEEYLYNSMNRDLYYLGKVLNIKYRYLSITYIIFVIGMIVSSLAFVITIGDFY